MKASGRLIPVILLCFLTFRLAGQPDSDSVVVNKITIQGNYITKPIVILREIVFREDEKVGRGEIAYRRQTSINNLTRTSLFNFVEINISESDDNIEVIIDVTERWYIWPNLYLNHTERNFSEWWRTKDLDKLEYGAGIMIFNFRGMGEALVLNYRTGNFLRYELEYRDIYLDRAKRHSLSLKGTWYGQKVLPYIIMDNRQATLKSDDLLQRSRELYIKYRYRKGYFNTHSLELGFRNYNIADTLYSLNPYYAGLGTKSNSYFILRYEFSSDNRDSRIYPTTGHLFDVTVERKGLGILPGEYGSTGLRSQLYLYKKLSERFYAASGLWYSHDFSNEYVFSEQGGVGYLQFVRGFEYYVANGDNAILFKNLLKYKLMPVKVISLKFWPVRNLHQFNRVPLEIYTNIFFDTGYVTDRFDMHARYGNTLVEKAMFGTGAGIDFITYYDKVFRLDYSFNSIGDHGLFIHWKAAIR